MTANTTNKRLSTLNARNVPAERKVIGHAAHRPGLNAFQPSAGMRCLARQRQYLLAHQRLTDFNSHQR
jgi:hypothetical protein